MVLCTSYRAHAATVAVCSRHRRRRFLSDDSFLSLRVRALKSNSTLSTCFLSILLHCTDHPLVSAISENAERLQMGEISMMYALTLPF